MLAGNQRAANYKLLLVAHSWGYTYTVFFDGNAFYQDFSAAPVLTADATNGACSPFSTTIDGVLTPLTVAEYDVSVDTTIAAGGFTLTPTATANDVTDGLSVLPSVNAPMLTYRGVADEQQGNSWTLSFPNNAGAVAELVCIAEATSAGIYCDVSRSQDFKS